jgi:hypothetical protein
LADSKEEEMARLRFLILAVALVLAYVLGAHQGATRSASAQSGTAVATPPRKPAKFAVSRKITSWRSSKIISVLLTAQRGIHCRDQDMDTTTIGDTPACTLSSSRMPLQPIDVGYVWQDKGSGPWYPASEYPFFHVRWNNGQLQLVTAGTYPGTTDLVMKKGTVVKFYALIGLSPKP